MAEDSQTQEIKEQVKLQKLAGSQTTKIQNAVLVYVLPPTPQPPPLLIAYFFVSPFFFYIRVSTSVCFHSCGLTAHSRAVTVGFW